MDICYNIIFNWLHIHTKWTKVMSWYILIDIHHLNLCYRIINFINKIALFLMQPKHWIFSWKFIFFRLTLVAIVWIEYDPDRWMEILNDLDLKRFPFGWRWNRGSFLKTRKKRSYALCIATSIWQTHFSVVKFWPK